jgi:hypothetical protein
MRARYGHRVSGGSGVISVGAFEKSVYASRVHCRSEAPFYRGALLELL